MEQILDEELIKRYLLGNLPEAQSLELEATYFNDEEQFDQIEAVENDLIEGYVCGKLTPDDRERFEESYLSSPQRREQVRFFQTLMKLVPPDTSSADQPSSVIAEPPAQEPEQTMVSVPVESFEKVSRRESLLARLRGLRLSTGLAFAVTTLILIGGGAWLVFETARLRRQLAENEMARNELKRQMETQREGKDQLSAELENVRRELEKMTIQSSASAPAMVSFPFAVGGLRSSDTTLREIVIQQGVKLVELKFLLPEVRYQSYGAAMDISERDKLWSRAGVKPIRTKSGALVVVRVPADWFKKGAYTLILSGTRNAGEPDPIKYFSVKVEKR